MYARCINCVHLLLPMYSMLMRVSFVTVPSLLAIEAPSLQTRVAAVKVLPR